MKKEKTEHKYNSDITKEDLEILGEKARNIHRDSGDDKILGEREKDVDFAGKDLDVPGRNLPSSESGKTLKDEENQLYSQGGTDNEDLERNTEHIE